MKAIVVQPRYPRSPDETREALRFMCASLDALEEDADLVLLPECANAPGVEALEDVRSMIAHTTAELLGHARDAARRTGAVVAVSLLTGEADGLHNHTLVVGAAGTVIADCEKAHLTRFERSVWGVSTPFAQGEFRPVIFTAGGARCACVTCFDVYFAEYFSRLAAMEADLILLPSYQRGEKDGIIRTQSAARALDTGAYIVRASYSMGEDAGTGGHSLIASPEGVILMDAGQRVGCFSHEIHPEIRRTRPPYYGQAPVSVNRILEECRRPWLYRTGGPMMVRTNADMPYPRVISHRGFNTVAPENTMPAFGAAVALGADEIELDVWPSRDGGWIVCHDPSVDRTSDGHGYIRDLDTGDLRSLDAGGWFDPHFEGLRFPSLQEVLQAFSGMTQFNIHVQSIQAAGFSEEILFGRLIRIVEDAQCRPYAYIAGDEDVLDIARRMEPDLARCCLAGQHDGSIVDKSVRYGCGRLQLYKPDFTKEMIERAHSHGIRCNVFWADDPLEAEKYLEDGTDAVLTNDLLRVMPAVRKQAKR